MTYQREKLVKLAVQLLRQDLRLTEADVSVRLGVHRHTLRRALKANGTSFAGIKQAFVLERLERHFAAAQTTSLKQLWTKLGFAPASAFARYVRHATGKSPNELRAECTLGHRVRKRAGMSLDVKQGGLKVRHGVRYSIHFWKGN